MPKKGFFWEEQKCLEKGPSHKMQLGSLPLERINSEDAISRRFFAPPIRSISSVNKAMRLTRILHVVQILQQISTRVESYVVEEEVDSHL